METKQEKYHQSEKGKAARRRAMQNYVARMVKWEAFINPELSAALDRAKPEGMSKQAFIKKIFQGYIDKVDIQKIYSSNESQKN